MPEMTRCEHTLGDIGLVSTKRGDELSAIATTRWAKRFQAPSGAKVGTATTPAYRQRKKCNDVIRPGRQHQQCALARCAVCLQHRGDCPGATAQLTVSQALDRLGIIGGEREGDIMGTIRGKRGEDLDKV